MAGGRTGHAAPRPTPGLTRTASVTRTPAAIPVRARPHSAPSTQVKHPAIH